MNRRKPTYTLLKQPCGRVPTWLSEGKRKRWTQPIGRCGAPQLSLETLESRRLLAGDWHNEVLRCDVDGSGFVSAFDAVFVVNDINAAGSRRLPERMNGAVEPFLDVSNDQFVSPLDVLLIVNAINSALPHVPIAYGTDADSDPNGNGVVLSDRVRLLGQTSAFARVTLTSDRTAEEQLGAWTVRVDQTGAFAFDVPLGPGLNRLQVDVFDEVGRRKSTVKEFRRGDIITDWNAAALNVVRDWSTTSNDPYTGRIVTARPPEVARNLAMIHTAMFDAVNAVEHQFEFYAYAGSPALDASGVAAAATAAHRVASALYSASDEIAVWDATLAESLATIPNDAARAKGIELGKSVAQTILALRQNDGADRVVDYQPGSGPGDWRRTFPDFVPALLPQWPSVQPFVIASAENFRVPPPPALDSAAYATAVDEVMRIGSFNSSHRTTDQADIAVFWADGGGTATPPGHWNRIATDVVQQESLSLVDSARTFALLNLALADAGIVSWDSKYAYELWRPVDAIRLAGIDGNPTTVADSTWLPLLRTPPFPTYTSGHSTFSGAASAVLTELFGDHYDFASTTDAHSGPGQRPLDESLIVSRSFTSFEHAAQEAGLSRIYGGIHFSFDNTQGLVAGANVGSYVLANSLRRKA